ncbi:MFS transporter [uncultured Clostridium sp.]|jgi:predicted MFS family arabinose efflux permease|uniref:MFS transporter n=1 Tax=uncultured Clostridium sp. TaxID=59620 RepID=UPI0026144E64|nr:MFS transporter [uncultured Clostridium sp.]
MISDVQSKEEVKKRWNWNCYTFIAGFVFLGIITGVSIDTFVSYLQLKSPEVTAAFSSYLGVAILIGAIIITLIPRFGYKKILLPFPILIIISIIGIMYVKSNILLGILIVLFLSGINVSQYVLAPMLSSYTTLENRTKMFSRALYANMAGTAIGSLFDGNLVVYFFSKYLHIGYSVANNLSAHPKLLDESQRLSYLSSYKMVFWIVCVLAVIAFVITLFLREKKEDYQENVTREAKAKAKFNFAMFENKDLIVWLIWTFLIGFGAALICPYFPVFLNEFLHIDRGVISVIIALTYVASVLFMMVTPFVEEKLGSIIALVGCFILTIPLFILIANGQIFGSFIVVGIGVTLFLRSGFANACQPIQQALPMSFVKKSDRAFYNAVITVCSSAGYILGGIFTKTILFTTTSGYRQAYYITAVCYLVANLLVLALFYKKYNRYTKGKGNIIEDSKEVKKIEEISSK